MTGRVVWRQERGRDGVALAYLGALTLVAGTVHLPPNLARWRRKRRLARMGRQLMKAGVRRLIFPRDFPWREELGQFRGVEPWEFYRQVGDVLALGALGVEGIPPQHGRVALVAPRLSPLVRATAERLCPRVRGLLIQVPGEGEDYARWLHGQYGLPVTPPGAGADVTVAFAPGGERWGRCLELYEKGADLGGLTLTASEVELPQDCPQQVLTLLWERGAVGREGLEVVLDTGEGP